MRFVFYVSFFVCPVQNKKSSIISDKAGEPDKAVVIDVEAVKVKDEKEDKEKNDKVCQVFSFAVLELVKCIACSPTRSRLMKRFSSWLLAPFR